LIAMPDGVTPGIACRRAAAAKPNTMARSTPVSVSSAW
jgi:hypothetical protein